MTQMTVTGKKYAMEAFLGKRTIPTTLYVGLTNASTITTLAEAYAAEPVANASYSRIPVLALPQAGSLSWTYATDGDGETASVTVQWVSFSADIGPVSKVFLTDSVSGSTGNVFTIWDLDSSEFIIPRYVTLQKTIFFYV